MIIWCMVPEIWSVMGRIFVILDWFLSFYNPKNQNFEKLKKKSGDIIILHMRTINDNQTMYGSWDIEYDRQTFLLFWAIFCPFTPLTAQKIKLSKKWKKVWRYHHFTRVPKIMIWWCMVPEKWCATDRRTNKQEKWHTEVGIPSKKIWIVW